MLVVTSNDLGQLHKALTDMDDRALPYAVRNSLNQSAFATRRQWEVEGHKTMHVRRSWAFRHRIPKKRGGGLGHAVEKARLRKSIHQMESKSGNTHKFMEEQERGFTRYRTKGIQIPTTKSRISQNIARVVRKRYHREEIELGPRFNYRASAFNATGPRGAHHRYIAASARAARKRGERFVYLEFSKNYKGIYDLGTGKGGRGSKIKKVWDMSHATTTTKRNPMLRRTLKKLEPTFKAAHRSALENQIRFVLKKRGFRVRGPNVLAEVARFQGQ